MCSLCITSITNINARLSAGIGTRQVCSYSVQEMCLYVCVCVYLYLVRTARKGFYEGSLGQTGGHAVHVSRQRRCVLGTINTERLLSWVCVFRNTWGWGGGG